jgi:hypothetical protein
LRVQQSMVMHDLSTHPPQCCLRRYAKRTPCEPLSCGDASASRWRELHHYLADLSISTPGVQATGRWIHGPA